MSTPSGPFGETGDQRPDVRTLTSWKDIAAYLGTTVRTAQRWERERELPVRRLPGPRGQVYAEIYDLEQWRNARPKGEPDEPVPVLPVKPALSSKGWLFGGLLAVVIGAATWMAFSVASQPPTTPVSVRVHDRGLIVFDRQGKELWHKEFPDLRLNMPSYSQSGKTLALAEDVDGDRSPEVLFALQPVRSQGTIICYAADGAERWRYTPGGTVRTRSDEFAAPFSVLSVVVGRVSPAAETLILTLSNHHAFFPSEAALLTGKGEVRARYWHSGHLHAGVFWDIDSDGTKEILLGGVSNAHRQGRLVALDASRFGGASDESDRPDYQIIGFPIAAERAQVIFPRTALAKAHYPLGTIFDIEREENQLLIHVVELFDGITPLSLMWTLDRRLRFRDVSASSGLAHAYERVRQQAGGEDLKTGLASLGGQLVVRSGKQ